MIKRIIGIVATLAVLALVVFAAIGSGSYKSIVFGKEKAATEQVVAAEPAAGAAATTDKVVE